jgi:peptidoglycan hydrolase-like protein with peptidoglycan-binding domain
MLDLHGISRASFDLIVDEEVSGREAYERKYIRPEKPGGASGVTVGIGYDCGYYTAAQIRSDWAGHLPPEMIEALASCAGIKGDAAFAACDQVKHLVSVPWDAAIDVFSKVSIPKYLTSTRKGLPNFDDLLPDCRGALLSLVYNRGASFSTPGDRYSEMRAIRAAMVAKTFASIPAQLRSMKRLWTTKSVRGVALRREHEARLFEQGLAAMGHAPPAEPPIEQDEPDPAAPFQADQAPAAAPAAAPIAATDVQGDPELFSVQQRLKARNYSPGVIAGVWGGMTSGAVAAFINDRRAAIAVPTSFEAFNAVREDVKGELARAEAEQWVRPVSQARASGDVATVTAVAPEAAPVRRNFLTSLWVTITTFAAAVWSAISDKVQQAFAFFTDHKDDIPTDPGVLSTAWSYAEKVPSSFWLILLAGVLAFITIDASRGLAKIRQSVQTGARQ